MQSIPAGRLRDRQVVPGEPVPTRPGPARSQPSSLGTVCGERAGASLSAPCVGYTLGLGSDPGAATAGPSGQRQDPRCSAPPPCGGACGRSGHSPVGERGEWGAAGASRKGGAGKPGGQPPGVPLPDRELPSAAPCQPSLQGGGHGPVLKHGPRSAGLMQGERILIPMYRNESDHTGPTGRATAPLVGPPRAGSTPPGCSGACPRDRCGVV